MLFAWTLSLQLITSFVIEICKINTLISVNGSHFKGIYFCKLIHHQNIALYIYSYIYCEFITPCHCFLVKPASL